MIKSSRILKALFKTYWTRLLLILIMGLASVTLSFLFVWLSKLLIDVATGDSSAYNFWGIVIAYIALIFSRIVVTSASKWVTTITSAHITKALRAKLYNALLYTRWNELFHLRIGDLTSRMLQDAKEVTGLLVGQIPALVIGVIQLAGALVFIYFIDARVTWGIICLLPFVLFFSRKYFQRMRTITHRVKSSESDLFSYFNEVAQHQLILRIFGQQSNTLSHLEKGEKNLVNTIKAQLRFSVASGLALKILFTGGYGIAMVWAIYRLHLGLITFGSVVAFLQLVSYIQSPTYNTVKLLPSIASALTATDRLEELLQLPEERHTPKEVDYSTFQAIEATELSFGYNGREEVLKKVHFSVKRGEMIAITGVTGTGKTTLFKLLLGLEIPAEGALQIRQADGSYFPINELSREAFAYVPQERALFSGTIRENLLLGLPEATEEELLTALQLAVADYVLQLTDGLDTQLTEGG
ncbi:ABC transporter ATP-binding protein, partial [uncultured Porphyromonas sp.]|uniref:ABC transporter transmembrane domain-containing protein n=1 Tax=uncultured Porphyromonas sp. TaxID=159274 RepID=UPI00260ACB96